MYALWVNEAISEDSVELELENETLVDTLGLGLQNRGLELKKKPELPISLQVKEGSEFFDIIYVPAMGLVVVDKVIEAFNKAGLTNIDYYPVTIAGAPPEIKDTYSFAHIKGIYEVLDRDACEIMTDPDFPDQIESIDFLALDTAKIPGQALLFWLKEYPVLLIVNIAVLKELKEAEVKGIRIMRPEDFTI